LLKLRAHDAEDLQVIAAHLQDAIVPVSEMLFLPYAQRFILVANRFRWAEASAAPEAPAEGDASFEDGPPSHFERIHCGMRFDRVRRVRHRGLDRRARGEMLNLLTIAAAEGSIDLVFAGGADLRLETASIDCRLEDIGEAWPTRWRPRHAVAQEVEG
jgi:hypothetical protein